MRRTAPSALLTVASALGAALLSGCATTSAPASTNPGPVGAASSDGVTLCSHAVPAEKCTRCHPELKAAFERSGDWCAEHGVPESQCLTCHPDLVFTAPAKVADGADVEILSRQGEDVPLLAAHAAAGKVTVFDFYADWCGPCGQVDRHVFALLERRRDVAYRKLNIGSWDTALAKRYLADVPSLPFVVVYGKDGKEVRSIAGLDLGALDAALAAGGAR